MALSRSLFLMAALLATSASQVQGEAPDPWWKVHFKVRHLADSSDGQFTIMVRPEWAPVGARRFAQLAHEGFFIESRFFRVVPDFVAQFGISPDPYTNEVWRQRAMKDDMVATSNTRGRLAFATSGPNSRTTQIFINFGDNSYLDAQGFAPFAEVIEGMEVVDKIYKEYGEGYPNGRGPDQAKIIGEGNDYLTNHYPLLSTISELWFEGDIPGYPTEQAPASPEQ